MMTRPAKFGEATLALLACGLVFGICGCQKRTVQAAPPVIATPQPIENPPLTPQPATNTAPAPEMPAPAKQPPANPTSKPAPRRPAPAPKETSEQSQTQQPKPAAPQMSQQLSPADQVIYERNTNGDIASAEKNLQQVKGREINAAQHDLVEKIQGFLTQARDAIRESDWVRARNLAQKAFVLSVELANSL
jgi:type IV secretory pathway VirB10-like protein